MLNKRNYPRYDVSLEVLLNSLSVANRTARMTDISLGGCYITTILSVEVGEKIQMQIRLPTGTLFTIKGIVKYRDQHIGFGIEFNLGESEKQLLEALIDYVRYKT